MGIIILTYFLLGTYHSTIPNHPADIFSYTLNIEIVKKTSSYSDANNIA